MLLLVPVLRYRFIMGNLSANPAIRNMPMGQDEGGTGVFRIVLTGGPGGGKTSILRWCAHLAEIAGSPLFTIKETATSLKRNGKRSGAMHRSASSDFQRLVIGCQFDAEESFLRKVGCQKASSTVLLDRGIFDSVGYIAAGEYERLVAELSLSVSDVLARYDKIIFLRSSVPYMLARGERFSVPNAARFIDHVRAVETAIETHVAQHPNVAFIPVQTNLRERLRLVLDAIMFHQ